ncbi:hypothetical protein QCA50_003636 [Cerrena zonata]|uniref:3-hydroxyisobutyryl-CoA hydrolase n=1 Tax=Cerrena zonata TaxID=2478898 RepID=A0AAW0GWS3_9APHY
MASTSNPAPSRSSTIDVGDEDLVLFESVGNVRKYTLNREKQLNALNEPMLNLLRPYVEDFIRSDLGKVLVGTGKGRGFCAGGDVATVARHASNPDTRPKAIEFFHREFELDYLLAAVGKPYIAIMDGITMGGGVGLSLNAPFRIATEKTVYAMPETKIGYAPDVGASHFLSRVDGELGTYLGLTGEDIRGRAVFESGLATHFVPSRRLPGLLEKLNGLDNPTFTHVDSLIEEHYSEREPDEPSSTLVGAKRSALDFAFRHDKVESIIEDLEAIAQKHQSEDVKEWAQKTLDALNLRSPTSLRIALTAIRRGKHLSLREALQMELNFATAICNGETPDFVTGVTAVLVEKIKNGRPNWAPSSLADVSQSEVVEKFFKKYTPEHGNVPTLSTFEDVLPNDHKLPHPMRWALPTEKEIRQMVVGSHHSSGSTQITLPEMIKKFSDLRNDKNGIKEKIHEVISRKCKESQSETSGLKYLSWVR